MIKVEGYRAFHGTMRINYGKGCMIAPYELTGDFLYKPQYKCWYGQGMSFPEECCEVVRDDAVHGKWIDNGDYVTTAYGHLDVYKCSVCQSLITIDEHDNYCPHCGATMDGMAKEGDGE